MAGRRNITMTVRFQLKVWQRGDCYEWRGERNARGYGIFAIQSDPLRAHRVAFELAKGPLRFDDELHHICAHPWCVRPSHLVPMRRSAHMLSEHGRAEVCERGHRIDATNVYVSGTHRQCRICKLEADRRRRSGAKRSEAAVSGIGSSRARRPPASRSAFESRLPLFAWP